MTGQLSRETGGKMAIGTGTPRLLTLILLGILAVRLVGLWLARTDLFFDEAQYWSWAQEPALGYYSKPPLIAWVIAATTAVCGDGEPCVRLAAPILHTVTAGVIYLIGRRLYDAQVGFWSAIVYATLPGVSFSSGIISTDVPYLLCWALALLGFVRLRESGSLGDALLLGAAIGAGFMARYGMAFFVGSMLVALVVLRGSGARVGAARWLIVALVALLVVSPNLYWNYANGFPTFGHTADNAKWTGSLFHPLKALEFFGAQFGVFGPVLFGALLVIVWRLLRSSIAVHHEIHPPPQLSARGGGGDSSVVVAPRDLLRIEQISDPRDASAFGTALAPGSPPPRGEGQGGRHDTRSDQATFGTHTRRAADRLLLCFVLPILVIYIAQAFLSRAHANWAAAGYVAATVLVVATMFRDGARRWFKGSLWLHGVVAAIIAIAPAFAGRLTLPVVGDPLQRLIGSREMAERVRSEVQTAAGEGKPYAAIVIDDRGTLAEHLYYLSDVDIPILAWPSGPVPKDHYEMTRPYRGEGPALLVSATSNPFAIINRFERRELRLTSNGSYMQRDWRPLHLWRLEGYRPAP